MEHQTTGTSAQKSSGACDSPQPSKIMENVDVAVLSIPITPVARPNPPSVIPVAECRRSSRKKIIKFDVRDLLNKNRRPHKIQIEARIDSNVPNTSKTCGSVAGGETLSTNSGLTVVGSQDLSSKQKAFMEKSAIFRRFSISQDQSKPPPPPPIPLPPTILGKVGDINDVMGSMNVTGKRLNRSQEYYNNALLKPKQMTSLIVAQVESKVRSVELKSQTNNKPPGYGARPSYVSIPEPPQQKKRGRPPKIRSTEPGKKSPTIGNTEMEKSKLSPEKAKNWKEYKACLAERYTKQTENSSNPKGQAESQPTLESITLNTSVAANEEDLQSSKKISTTNELTAALGSFADTSKPQICLDITSDDHSEINKASKQLSVSFAVKEPTEALSDKTITSTLEERCSSGEPIGIPTEIGSIKEVYKPCLKEESEKTILQKNHDNKTNQEIQINTRNIDKIREKKELTLVIENDTISNENLLCGKDNLIPKEIAVVTADTLSEDKTVSLRRASSASENSGNTSLSSVTTPSTTTHKSKSSFESSYNRSSSSEVLTSKEKNSTNTPDDGRRIIEETKRSQRLQKKAKDVNRLQNTAKNIDVDLEKTANNKEGQSEPSQYSENSLQEDNILLENEKYCDGSIENSSSDSLSSTDISELKDSELKRTQIFEENYSNDSPKSSIPKPKEIVYTQQRKSLRKRKQYSKQGLENLPKPKIQQNVQKSDHNNDITQTEANKDEAPQQDMERLKGEKCDSKKEDMANKGKLQLSNTTPEVLHDDSARKEETPIKTQPTNEHTEIEKKENTYNSADDKLPYVKRKSLRSQRDDVASSSIEIFEENEPLNIKNKSNKPRKEENLQPMEESLTYFKRKSERNQKDHIALSSEENVGNQETINIMEKEATNVLVDANIESKGDHKTKLENPASTVRKSLRKQKELELPYSPEDDKDDGPPEAFKTKENLVLHTFTDADSHQAAGAANTCCTKSAIEIDEKSTNIEKVILTQKICLRKHTHEDKASPQNVIQDKFETENIIDTTPITVLNDSESVADKEIGLFASTSHHLLSDEEYKKGSKNPVSTPRMSLRKHKNECELFSESSQQSEELRFISNDSQFAKGKYGNKNTLICSNIQPTEKHQTCVDNLTFTQNKTSNNQENACEHFSPERNIVTTIGDNSQKIKIISEKSENAIAKDADMTNLTSTNNKSTEEQQTCITKSTSVREKVLRNPDDKNVPYSQDENIHVTNGGNSQQAEQPGITFENSQHKIRIDVEVTASTFSNIQSIEEHQTCSDTYTQTQSNSLQTLKEDELPYYSENVIDVKSSEVSKKPKDVATSLGTAVQSKAITDKSKSVTRKSFRKQQDEIVYSLNIKSTNMKEVADAVGTRQPLDPHNISESINVKGELEDLALPSPSLKDVDTKELSNILSVITVHVPTADIYQTLQEDSNIATLSPDKPITSKKIASKDEGDGIAHFLVECENDKSLSEPPKSATNVSVQESHQLSDKALNVQTKCVDKQTLPKRTSLRKQKEAIVLSNDDTLDQINKEKCIINNVYTTEEQLRKTTKRNENDCYSPLENVKKAIQIELHNREYMIAASDHKDENSQTDIEPKTTVDVTPCNDKGTSLLKSVETETTVSKDLGLISPENNEKDKQDETPDKEEIRIIGALTPESECSQPSDDTSNVKRKRSRKSRFKNLHGPDSEPENALSSGDNVIPVTELSKPEEISISCKETPIKIIPEAKLESKLETISQIMEELTKSTPLHVNEANKFEINKDILENSKEETTNSQPSTEKKVDVPKEETTNSSQSSTEKKVDVLECRSNESTQTIDLPSTSQKESTNVYVIKNLSIETNTLLDILRTVQSNEEAAVEAKKACDSVVETQDSEVAVNASTTTNVMTRSKLIGSNSSSPCRLDSGSPSTLKKVPSSPCRSDTSSPLTLKKCNSSPCRLDSASPSRLKKVPSPSHSDSSSPLTLKKCNSSPSRSDTSSPLSLNKKITRRYERRSRRGDDSTHKTLEETFAEIAALSSQAVLEMSSQNDDIKEEQNAAEENNSNVIKEVSAEIEKPAMDFNTLDIKEGEVEVEVEESNMATPTQKLNQPKTRSAKVDTFLTDSVESTNKYEQCKEVLTPTTNEEVTPVDPETSDNNKINDVLNRKDDHKDASTNLDPKDNNTNSLMLTKDCHQEIKPGDQQSDKPNEKNDSLTQQTKDVILLQKISKTSLVQEKDATKIREDECLTPKSSPNKRDSTLSKTECKSANKKSSKKSKTPENIELAKIDDHTTKPTTPPPKRGRKPKATMQADALPSPASNSGSKKKIKKDQKEEEASSEPKNDVETESEIYFVKSVDENMAKKKRQRKLKEAFEAALNKHPVEFNDAAYETPASSPTYDINLKSTLSSDLEPTNCENTTKSFYQVAAIEPEEDPDPLKDIEKFIEDGVNLLKKAYKIDEDSVDNVIIASTQVEQRDITTTVHEDGTLTNKEIFTASFETPADTPITTPSVTPPPKSPESSSLSEEHSSGGVRRSHRIKLITKTPKALVGRGLVRDKERFSIKDDVETKSHYTLDDHLLDLAEVEAKNAKFLKEMEERLSNFQVIKDNEYKCERVISKEARKMICDCFLTAEEEVRGELACGEDCLNRLLMIECGPECNIRERCTNKRFQKLLCSPCRVFRTEKKGFGIMADIEILPGEFIMEYVGEVIDTDEFERRRIAYSQDKNRHYYFMALRSDAIIDATIKGNISRFINHSCDPNAETQKWTVNGELRIGFFSRKSIMPGEEITFNYQYQRYGREAQRCYCESVNCRGWIGQEPTSDEGEQIDDDDYESDEEEDEEEDNSNLLEEDDDDSDASVSDPEEVQKKLEMAAAQAAAELAPITLEDKPKLVEGISKEKEESSRPGIEEEDSKSKFKKLLSKMAEKVAAKHKQTKREQKLQRKKKSKESSSELVSKQRFLEDPDIEDEVEFLSRCGLKNQSDTLRLSRLMVRAKLVQTRLNLLDILRKGELPCRRLFLDYHGLRLVHGWMSEDAGNMQIRLALLLTLELLPIANKTMLTDSKVMQVVRNWCGSKEALSPNEDSLSSNSNSQDGSVQPSSSGKISIDDSPSSECVQLQKLALKLVATWDGLPEIFRIPKKERIEQMKEHEREADRQYAETEGNRHSADIDKTNRFGKRVNATKRFGKPHCSKQLQTTGNTLRSGNMTPENLNYISKAQRREMFAAKVARDEAEKRMAEERREFETKCRFFGLDPKKTRPQDIPFCVNPTTGQWYSVERKPITTPPSYAHVQVPEKHKSTNPVDYQLPAVCATLPPQWKYAITPLGQIYYYHVQYRVPQWEPPTPSQLHDCEINIEEVDSGNEHTPTTGADSSDDDDDILVGMDAAQLKAYIDRKVETRRQKRYQRLVDERAISPRREEDRVYNQSEVRKYKENKEKIRKRKEEIRRKRAEALRQSSLNMCTLGSLTELNPNQVKSNETENDIAGVLPIQDYLLSSDEDEDIKMGLNSPLIDKIVEGDKIVDELDALTTKKPLKRPLPPHREINEPSSSSSASASSSLTAIERQDYKKRKLEKKDKRKPKEQDAKYRKTKEKFRCEIAGIIVHHLKAYRKDTCTRGRIQSNDDFNHLARKLTHFVMIKELKYCESVGQTLVVTESVKNKSREFIKKYMTKYGDFYVKPSNDPEFKDIPFTL